jgi:hypothetical protein
LPIQILREVHRNLSPQELSVFYQVLDSARELQWGFSPPAGATVKAFEEMGAKKGDAVIAGHLQESGVTWLVSENRHFLAEISGVPFRVISASEALAMTTA